MLYLKSSKNFSSDDDIRLLLIKYTHADKPHNGIELDRVLRSRA